MYACMAASAFMHIRLILYASRNSTSPFRADQCGTVLICMFPVLSQFLHFLWSSVFVFNLCVADVILYSSLLLSGSGV